MLLHDIKKLLTFQEVEITNIENKDETAIELYLEPVEKLQPCPCCRSRQVIRKGKDGYRIIVHLSVMGKTCYLRVPQIRLMCKTCHATFNWQYSFVKGKQRYTTEYKNKIFKSTIGATVQHIAEMEKTPYSTIERFFKEFVLSLGPLTEKAALEIAQSSTRLILGIDDFAIRKGHNYNTGIHDLRGETLLSVIKGRTISDLRKFVENNPEIAKLSPYAVVMDLAKQYHLFVSEIFPNAIRVADRFHVNRFIIDALDSIRKRVQATLPPHAKIVLSRISIS